MGVPVEQAGKIRWITIIKVKRSKVKGIKCTIP